MNTWWDKEETRVLLLKAHYSSELLKRKTKTKKLIGKVGFDKDGSILKVIRF